MTTEPSPLRDFLAEANPDALFIGVDGEFDKAILGTTERDGNIILAYNREGLIACLIASGMEPEDAEDWCSFNIEGAYMGEHTPIIIATDF